MYTVLWPREWSAVRRLLKENNTVQTLACFPRDLLPPMTCNPRVLLSSETTKVVNWRDNQITKGQLKSLGKE